MGEVLLKLRLLVNSEGEMRQVLLYYIIFLFPSRQRQATNADVWIPGCMRCEEIGR